MESRTDGNGSYSFRMPAGVEFHVTADSFPNTGTAVKVTGGMLITDAAQVTETDITLQYANLLEGISLVERISTKRLWNRLEQCH